ncbi:MAG: hypothetical protein C4576_27005 [Desulfobacteraceae bacterium]|nr:MAG: hypothetical protein C4576_27005 [Desulfobacteraceae bacterium]
MVLFPSSWKSLIRASSRKSLIRDPEWLFAAGGGMLHTNNQPRRPTLAQEFAAVRRLIFDYRSHAPAWGRKVWTLRRPTSQDAGAFLRVGTIE